MCRSRSERIGLKQRVECNNDGDHPPLEWLNRPGFPVLCQNSALLK